MERGEENKGEEEGVGQGGETKSWQERGLGGEIKERQSLDRGEADMPHRKMAVYKGGSPVLG